MSPASTSSSTKSPRDVRHTIECALTWEYMSATFSGTNHEIKVKPWPIMFHNATFLDKTHDSPRRVTTPVVICVLQPVHFLLCLSQSATGEMTLVIVLSFHGIHGAVSSARLLSARNMRSMRSLIS